MAANRALGTVSDARPAAVLWDLDGTIVDTEPYWLAEQTDLLAAFGASWSSEEALSLVGAGLGLTAVVLQNKGVPWEAERIIDHLTDRVMARVRRKVPWRPGARELLSDVRAAGIPTALVTMSVRRMAQQVADAATGTGATVFDVIVSGSDVTQPKPHPEAYLTAAALLGVAASQCVAIEDSTPGLAAAVAAGTVAIGVPLMTPLHKDQAAALWPSLAGRRLSDLTAVYARGSSQLSAPSVGRTINE